jgi:hypothetical protein
MKRTLLTPGAEITLSEIASRTGIEETAVRAEFADIGVLLTATMMDEIETVIAGLAHRELSESLVRAAVVLSDNQLLEALAGPGAAMLAQMARVDVRLPGWQLAAHAVEDALARAGRTGSPMLLRWLASYLCAPSTEDEIRRDVDILVAGLPPVIAHDHWQTRPAG